MAFNNIKPGTAKTGKSWPRTVSFLIVLAVYLAAFFAGFFALILFKRFSIHILVSFFLADIIATLVVWISGIIFNNSSVYDPYWSVAPVVIIFSWAAIKQVSFSSTDILIFAAIILWSIRLTYNWAIRWKGLGHQDWRYVMLKAKSPKMWFLTNLAGINLVPTIIVYLAMVPVYYGLGTTLNGGISAITVAGFAICISAVFIQAISDMQMDNFRKTIALGKNTGNAASHIDSGLWRYSRHPNYFGEVLFWWGIWIIQAGTVPKMWFTVAGPILVTLLFIFISIPMMEKYIMSSRPSYAGYKKKVSILVPWFRFKI